MGCAAVGIGIQQHIGDLIHGPVFFLAGGAGQHPHPIGVHALAAAFLVIETQHQFQIPNSRFEEQNAIGHIAQHMDLGLQHFHADFLSRGHAEEDGLVRINPERLALFGPIGRHAGQIGQGRKGTRHPH